MGSKGFPYAASPARGFPYGRLGEFLVDSRMRNSCYTMARLKKNAKNRKYPLRSSSHVVY
jgi:hypothetical protein